MAKKLVKFLFVLMAMSASRVCAIGADESFIKTRSFAIPININGGQKEKIKEIELFLSTDEGKTWNQQAVIGPEKPGFSYTAPTDGVYWFKVCTIDKTGNREPNDIYKQGTVNKIIVDSLPPTLRIVKAERQGESIVVFWELQELNPDLSSFKLEYKSTDGFSYPVTITPAMVGQQSFRAPGNGPVKIKMTVCDLAGNQTPAEADVGGVAGETSNLTTTSMQVQTNSSGSQSNPEPTFPPVTTTAQAAPAPVAPPSQPLNPATQVTNTGQGGTNGYGAVIPTIPNGNQNSQFSNMPVQTGSNAAGSSSGFAAPSMGRNEPYQGGYTNPNTGARPIINSSLPPAPPNLAMQQPANNGANWPQNNGPNQGANVHQVDVRGISDRNWTAPAPRSAGGIGLPPGNPAGFVATRWMGGVQTMIANSTQITLNYRVDRVGPSGVGAVDLYLTEDEGRTWKRYAEDQDLEPPMVVDLPGEGIFGLKLVVTSKAGLGRRPPQDGDAPEMRVEVDMTPPAVKLFRPEPDSHRRDAIVLNWQATDRNLASNPITLQWAERPDGPWQIIASDLMNTGRHTWTVGPNLVRVYLRVVARDMAGNQGFDETGDPILVDLTEPEAKILGISSGVKRQ